MTDAETPPHPTRLLRCVAVFARWSLGLLLAFWLLLAAAWGVLHGWIVPRIGDFRPELETRAMQALGVPVRIGALAARSDGLIPTIELQDVALLDAQGREALRLPRVVAAISPRSLLKLGFEQLYLEGPELDVRRDARGRIFVAGMPFGGSPAEDGSGNSSAADWLFSQKEVAIRGGTVRWTDELRGAPPLALSQVDLVLRNGHWRHDMRLDATPPAEWGDRFTLRGKFRSPLLSAHAGAWERWSGQFYADFARVDVSSLNRYVDLLGARVAGGHGAVRAWADVQRGQLAGGTADLALAGVNTTLGARLQPLELRSVAGRVGGRRFADGFEVSTTGLQFLTDDGLRWPGGNLMLRHMGGAAGQQDRGELQADRLDLAALSEIASRLPLGEAAHRVLATYAPEGLVDSVQASWRGPLTEPLQYQARGRVSGLALAAPGQGTSTTPRVEGVRGATVDFDLTQTGGTASLAIADGALLLPGVFEDPLVPVQRLGASLRWQRDGKRLAVQASDLRFANADAEGEARLAWHTDDLELSPGVIDLTGSLQRADGTRVYRYLPLAIPQETRHYLRDAITSGSASQVQFRVKGDVAHIPASHPGQGEFRIAAKLRGVNFAYVPPRLQQGSGHLPWPSLTGLDGELIFDGAGMSVNDASGSFSGWPQVRVQKVNARIPDLAHSVVGVTADVRGPLADMLGLVRGSHVGQLIGGALDQASATGPATLQLQLNLPVSHIDTSTVRGSLALAGNDLRITPQTPLVERAQGSVQFTDAGFTLAGVRGRALGGEVRFDGGMRPPASPGAEAPVQVRAQGVVTAEGLRQASGLGGVSHLARLASGSTPYTVAIGVRRGVAEVQVATSLQGMALALPAPLGKPADAALPVRYENRLTEASAAAGSTAPLRDELVVDLGGVGSAHYLRDMSGPAPRVLSGTIALGLDPGESVPMPAAGVAANVHLQHVDVDAWQAALLPPEPAASPGGAASPAAAAASPDEMLEYLPQQLAVRAATVTRQGRTLHDVVAGVSRQGTTWRANVDASELDGYFEYRQGEGAAQGRLYARLSRLTIPQAAVKQVDDMLLGDDSSQPGALPSLDIVVQDFELRGRRLGRIEIEAQNQGAEGTREWLLSKFNLVAPEATFTSSGSWALVPGARGAGGSGSGPQRRTVMDFKLDIRDSGELLARFGMDGVIKRGKGQLAGQVAWNGAPISPDYRSMSGQMHVDVEGGQFLKAEPGMAKLLSVLSLQSLPRRFALDFRDVFSQGFAFDFVRGDVRIERGVATTNNLQMKGVNAAVLMEGSADIAHETQDLHVVVVPEINAMTASLVATAINPVVGLGSFLAQIFLRGPLIQAATQQFHIDGTWDDPRIERVSRRRPAGGQGEASGAAAPPPPSGDAS